jgi:Flp pilus assembly protein TadG
MGKSGRLRKGQSLVEFASLLPIMVASLVFMLDLGRLVYAYSVLANAAREGARLASALDDSHDSEIEDYIKIRIPGLEPTAINFSSGWITWNDCYNATYQDGAVTKEIDLPGSVQIKLDYTVDSIVLGKNLPVSASSKMRLENCLP